ncbi:DUF2551 domain-containing protein [Methanospirillum stamsii]|uniref:DUF2551 domain-containing protein n=1 Tax=Methanospirillum stamsii TaxID=1277351 RepID=A0A2V2N5A3_9EURY|nr:DUF2551 domain-containing protein [Methanospirillum stamsii]PWR72936.1 hypothetical protein DLD82_11755 [Methanospirillum stamsii]
MRRRVRVVYSLNHHLKQISGHVVDKRRNLMIPDLKTESMTMQLREQIVEQRLRAWISGDPNGVRRAALALFLHRKDLSIEEIHEYLVRSYPVTYHGVGGMIGLVSSRIGILQGIRDEKKRCRIYRLKEKDVLCVKRILAS